MAERSQMLATTDGANEPVGKGENATAPPDAFDLVGILSIVEETAYTWNIASDAMLWEANAQSILSLPQTTPLKTGVGFQNLIAPEHVQRRYAIIEQARLEAADAQTLGLPFRLHYRIQPAGLRSSQSIWIEEHGRWWPHTADKPERARGVIRVINESFLDEQRMLYRSDRDELTGQLNRIRLTEAIAATIGRAERTHAHCAVLVAAVNNLAAINDTFGFDVGDEVITAAARRVKARLRGGDTIGRYSSNKFGIILNACDAQGMRIAAERFIKAVSESPVRTSACQLSASISIGGVLIPEQAGDVHQTFDCALQALDRARHKRCDSFMAYEPSPIRETTRRRNMAIADDVISALDEHRMNLVLQPLVRADNGTAQIYEALLRMHQPDGEVVSAGVFIPVAEQLGLARLIDRRTLELAIDLLATHADLHISLNVSSLTAHDRDWMTALMDLTGRQRSFTERLVIEITETAAIHDLDQTVAFVDTLKELGCRVAIDDFGAGYTSFKNLKHLAVDIVKIDGAFVKDIVSEKSDQVFLRTLVALAQEFKMETVAEWVGDEATAELLREAGVDYLQGFHYGQPIEAIAYAQQRLTA